MNINKSRKIDAEGKRIISRIAAKIKEKYKPDKIILFGSYAHGNPDKDSDVDLLIIKDTNDRHIDRAIKIRQIIEDENKLIGVEPLVYTKEEIKKRLSKGDEFIKIIMNKGVMLYGKK